MLFTNTLGTPTSSVLVCTPSLDDVHKSGSFKGTPSQALYLSPFMFPSRDCETHSYVVLQRKISPCIYVFIKPKNASIEMYRLINK